MLCSGAYFCNLYSQIQAKHIYLNILFKSWTQATSPKLFFKIDIIEDIGFLLQLTILAFGNISFIRPTKKKLSKDLSINTLLLPLPLTYNLTYQDGPNTIFDSIFPKYNLFCNLFLILQSPIIIFLVTKVSPLTGLS